MDPLGEESVRRGAWLEIACDEPAALQTGIVAAGPPTLRHPATTTFHFAVPGGKVFGIPDPTAGELRQRAGAPPA